MSVSSLLSIFPKPEDLLALTPEDLGGAIIEVAPSLAQRGMFNIDSLVSALYPITGASYPDSSRDAIVMAMAESLAWLSTQGLIVRDPQQPARWYRLTRRAVNLHNRADVEVFRKGRLLPYELVPALLAQKVVPLFRRGDFDVAVFQAFKEVEVAVRKTANAKNAGYPDSDIGVSLMRKAFHPENGPLTDTTVVVAEREALQQLLAGAIGHAKNPTSHRDIVIDAQEAARLILFASYLLGIVEQRA
ncbi:TIGR02391 family protein [Methylocystis sp.]|uniref:TIGR02391 family protein n=1 Tax=Methylocystis sp. TaxID=1911079 RepID=UPI0025DE6121|nr:TIGR02391 family protein [Methylocystis sp.]